MRSTASADKRVRSNGFASSIPSTNTFGALTPNELAPRKLPNRDSSVVGASAQIQSPGIEPFSIVPMPGAAAPRRSRPCTTSSAYGRLRCAAPAALPVTTTRSSVAERAATGGATLRVGASTTCVPPLVVGVTATPWRSAVSAAPSGMGPCGTHASRSSGSDSLEYDRRTPARAATRSSAVRNEAPLDCRVTMRSSGGVQERTLSRAGTGHGLTCAAAVPQAITLAAVSSACVACRLRRVMAVQALLLQRATRWCHHVPRRSRRASVPVPPRRARAARP